MITEPGIGDRDQAVALARAVLRWEDQDFVAQVSPSAVREVGDEAGEPLVAIVDYGLKANIVNSLRRRGVRVRVLPHTASAQGGWRATSAASCSRRVPAIRRGDGPVALAVDGHRRRQAAALGLASATRSLPARQARDTTRLRFGHHGANHPVH